MQKSKHNKKAQTMIFEQVILFSIGVTIFVMCFAAFNIYQDYYESVSLNDQMGQLKSWITSHVIRIIENRDANTSIILEIPRRISGEEYEIEFDDEGISIVSFLSRTVKKAPLFNLTEQYNFSGRVTSTGRQFVIYKKGKDIIIS
jgi:hypothetical protein